MPRGRPRGKSNNRKLPQNYSFWISVIKNEEQLQDFLNRAKENRLYELGNVIKYIKTINKNLFEKIDGRKILKQIYKKR